jgi:hypothetical protein
VMRVRLWLDEDRDEGAVGEGEVYTHDDGDGGAVGKREEELADFGGGKPVDFSRSGGLTIHVAWDELVRVEQS